MPNGDRTGTEAGKSGPEAVRPNTDQHLGKGITMLNLFKSFANDKSGAVTVDWVVLTAAIVGLGILVMETVGGGIESLAADISSEVGSIEVGYGSSLD